jgi:hypothetical protein
MFKRIVFVLALVVGCGDDIDSSVEEPADGVCQEGSTHPDCAEPTDAGELGELNQPIIIHGEHGTTAAMGPCTLPFPGGSCYVPDHKSNIVAWHPYTCFKDFGGKSGAWWYQAVARGMKAGIDYVNARGWNIQLVTLDSPPAITVGNIQVKCDYGAGAIGQTAINEFGGTPFDCHSTQHGNLCQYNAGVISIRPPRAPSNPIWATSTTTEKSNMVYNVTLHEMLHFWGLPHRAHDPNNMNVMMPAIQAWLSTQWTTKMVPDVNQSLSLYCYVNTSSTTPIVGCPAN